jgi:hypothetical protein
MSIDFQGLLSGAKSTLPSIIGSGIGTTFISILFKRKFDKELEIQKAALIRGSKIHEHQVEIIEKLYISISEIQKLTQSISTSVSLKESFPEYEKELTEQFSKLGAIFRLAKSDFLLARLYLPDQLSKQIGDFFTQASDCMGTLFQSSSDHLPAGLTDPELLSTAYRTTIVNLPNLLKSIETQARKLIHTPENA